MGAQLAQFFSTNAPQLIIGATLGLAEAGLFRVGTRLVNVVTHQLFTPMLRVMYPGLADLSRKTDQGREGFRKINAGFLAILLPVSIGFALVSQDAIIVGLKELPEDGTPLPHRHIMFGHAYKGQHSGKELLRRFKAGGGTLYDLEYLVNDMGQRVAAFGYWAGFAGAAVAMRCWAAQARGEIAGPVGVFHSSKDMVNDLIDDLQTSGASIPSAIVIGALGRVGSGATELLEDPHAFPRALQRPGHVARLVFC